jgi:DNA circularisation protein
MSFDLNNAAQFAAATQSTFASPLLRAQILLNEIRGVSKWQIQEAAYGVPPFVKDVNPVRFHIFKKPDVFNAGLSQVSDTGGRRKAIYQFPYVDGQTTDDLGRSGETWSFDVIFFGPNYLQGWQNLYNQLLKSTSGTLIHPVRGAFTAVPKSWTFTHESATRQALLMRIDFIEHNFNIGSPTSNPVAQTPLSFINTALNKISNLVSAINQIQTEINATIQVKNEITAIVNDLITGYKTTLINFNLTFNNGSPINVPGAVPTTTSTTISPVAVPANNPFYNNQATNPNIAQAQSYTTQQAIKASNDYSAQVTSAIQTYKDNGLELSQYQSIFDIQGTAIALQNVLQSGLQNSQPTVLNYTLPVIMSLREVAFANGLEPDDMASILNLNPDLDSTNSIDAGTVLQVPNVAA